MARGPGPDRGHRLLGRRTPGGEHRHRRQRRHAARARVRSGRGAARRHGAVLSGRNLRRARAPRQLRGAARRPRRRPGDAGEGLAGATGRRRHPADLHLAHDGRRLRARGELAAAHPGAPRAPRARRGPPVPDRPARTVARQRGDAPRGRQRRRARRVAVARAVPRLDGAGARPPPPQRPGEVSGPRTTAPFATPAAAEAGRTPREGRAPTRESRWSGPAGGSTAPNPSRCAPACRSRPG